MDDMNAENVEQGLNLTDVFDDLDATIKPQSKSEDRETTEEKPLQDKQVNTVPNSTPSTVGNPFLNPFTQVNSGKSLLSTMNPAIRSEDTRKKDTGNETQEIMEIYGALGGTPHKTEYEEWRMPPR